MQARTCPNGRHGPVLFAVLEPRSIRELANELQRGGDGTQRYVPAFTRPRSLLQKRVRMDVGLLDGGERWVEGLD